jgi:hypothetical protein
MKLPEVLRRLRRSYSDDMSIIRRPPGGQVPPSQRPEGIERFTNQWVAVLDGKIIASGNTSRELASELRSMPPASREAVMEFVRPPAAAYVVGVG